MSEAITVADLESDLVVIGGPLADMLRARVDDLAEQPGETRYTALCEVLASYCYGVADSLERGGACST